MTVDQTTVLLTNFGSRLIGCQWIFTRSRCFFASRTARESSITFENQVLGPSKPKFATSPFTWVTIPSDLSSRLIEPPSAATRPTALSDTFTFYSDDKQRVIASGPEYWSGSPVHLDLQEDAASSRKGQ
jgi:hypothetical protein